MARGSLRGTTSAAPIVRFSTYWLPRRLDSLPPSFSRRHRRPLPCPCRTAFVADDLTGEVRDLIGEVGRLRAENEKLSDAFAKLNAEHQAVKDELARLKKRPLRER
jgi:hypothetical protein